MSTPTADVKLSAIAFLPIIRPGTISRCPRARYAVSWLSGFLATPLTRRMPLRVHAAYRADLAARNEEFLQQQVASFCILIGVACSALGGAVYAFFGELLVGAIWWAVTAILLGDWVLFKAGRIGWRGYVYAGCMPLPFAVSASVIALGGFNASCGVAIWGLVAPLIMRAMIGAKESLAMVGVYLANLAVSFVVPLYFPQTNSLPPRAQDFIFLFNLGASSSFVIVVLYYFIAQRDRLKERSEELLLNVLPALIAERLKRGETRIADTCTDVSIVFADIVGFTQLSSALPPGELVDLLNEVFSAFDELLGRYGIEKIKTIGDCYMAAVGVPTARSDHAEVAVRYTEICRYVPVQRPCLEFPDRHPFRSRRCRDHRAAEIQLRPLGQCGEHGQPHGVPWISRLRADQRTDLPPGHGRLRLRVQRHCRCKGKRCDAGLVCDRSPLTAAPKE